MIRQHRVIGSIYNGQWKQAKVQLQEGCKSKPELQAFRLAHVCCTLVDPEDDYKRPDLAQIFLEMFNPNSNQVW